MNTLGSPSEVRASFLSRRQFLRGVGVGLALPVFESALAPPSGERVSVTVELVFGQAFGRGPLAPRQKSGVPGEVAVPIERIREAAATLCGIAAVTPLVPFGPQIGRAHV